jgi:seryl-tRNA synthetase
MSENEHQEIYDDLKKIGFKLEQEINEWIKENINHEKVIVGASAAGKIYSSMLKKLHEYANFLSLHLNFPTKDDVSNTARLIIQAEEKLDNLEEQIAKVSETLESIKKKMDVSSAAAPNYDEDLFSFVKDETLKRQLTRWKKNSDSFLNQKNKQHLIQRKRRRISDER